MPTTYAINARSWAQSTFSGGFSSVSSVASVGNSVYALTPTDVYQHSGEDDDGSDIDCYADIGAQEFGDQTRSKFLSGLRFYGVADNGATITVTASRRGDEVTREYKMPKLYGTKDQSRLIKPARGIKAHSWRIRVANVRGGTFALRNLTAYYSPSKLVI